MARQAKQCSAKANRCELALRPDAYWHHTAVMRRVLLRMKGWLNDAFTEGH